MYFTLSFTFFTLITICVSTETTREPSKDVDHKTFPHNVISVPDSVNIKPHLKASGAYQPSTDQQSFNEDDIRFHHVILKSPHSVTKLAKSRGLGFDPYFKKGYFEPFERRQKPVTLIAFRRNGLEPRKNVKLANSEFSEVAELQSPYNDVSNFWQEGTGDF